MASTGSRRDRHSRSLRVQHRRLRWECVKRPVISCGFNGSHVFADGVAVNVVRAGAGHQFLGYIVGANNLLVNL